MVTRLEVSKLFKIVFFSNFLLPKIPQYINNLCMVTKLNFKTKRYGNMVNFGLLQCNHCLSMICTKLQSYKTFRVYIGGFTLLNKVKNFDVFV